MHLGDWSIDESLNRMIQEAKWQIEKNRIDVEAEEIDREFDSISRWSRRLLPLVLYLCTDEPEIEGKGPMAGIVSGLAVCRSRWLLIVPCDMPFFDIDAAGKLAMAIDMSDPRPVTAQGKNGKVPLPGIYPKDTADKIRGFLMQGIYRASDILEQIGSSMVKIDEKSLININTPEEYAIYGKR